jgi:uncharacterized protein
MSAVLPVHPAPLGQEPSARIFLPARNGAATNGAVGAFLADGRLHLQHGPIDLICEVWGAGKAAAYHRAAARFDGILAELVAELPALRSEDVPVQGKTARRMAAAVAPFRPDFITPMAAVAGAVAEEVLRATRGAGVTRAYVNNGGDIAFWLAPNEEFVAVIAGTGGKITITAADPVRGIATSGWRGRSWSFGIADAVTVLARTAPMADAAATMIANAVDLQRHPAIRRRPAVEMQADSDLGARLVTVAVGGLTRDEVGQALARGQAAAALFRARGLIEAAALFLQGVTVVVGPMGTKAVAA